MKITITPDITACVLAGIEPATEVEVDPSGIQPEDRASLADALGRKLQLSGIPTPSGVVEAARAAIAAATAAEAAKAAEAAAYRAASEAALAAYRDLPPVERQAIYGRVPYTRYDAGYPDPAAAAPYDYFCKLNADDPLRKEWITVHTARQAEAERLTEALRSAAKSAHEAAEAAAKAADEAERQAGIAARAAMSMGELGALLGRKTAPLALLSDDNETVVIRTGEHRAAAVPLAKPEDSHLRVLVGEKILDGRKLAVENGVLRLTTSLDRPWVAVVEDPSAVKPVYRFLDRCPGGYAAPQVVPGDVIVWGGIGGSRRRPTKERHDRLVVEVSDDQILCAAVDYASARKLRKQLI